MAEAEGTIAKYWERLRDHIDCWRAYRRLRRTLERGDMKTIADVKRELNL